MTATRRQAREWAIQMLTAADLNPPDDLAEFISAHWQVLSSVEETDGGTGPARGKLRAFAEERVVGVWTSREDIDAKLVSLLDNWDLYRLGTVERSVLRLGAWELSHTDVPKAVIINEAIDLANWFSTPKSRSLINGILDKLAKA